MSFVQRTTRDRNTVGFRKEATAAAVGPGAYNNAPPQLGKVRPSYAPFGSSNQSRSQSLLHAGNTTTPGAGAYDPQPARLKPAAATGFKSRTTRFNQPTQHSDDPGPGSYSHPSDFGLHPSASSYSFAHPAPHPQEEPAVKWVRVPTAPSIPAVNQSFGYEEGTMGELVLQKPIHIGYAGTKDSTVGPGEYNVGVDVVKKGARTVDFSRSRTQRFEDPGRHKSHDATLLGPGRYNHDPPPNPRLAVKSSAVFASAVQKNTFGEPAAAAPKKKLPNGEEAAPVIHVPGPGAYESPGTFGKVKKPEEMQFFGSTSRRFEQGPRTTTRQFGGPGPGYYQEAEAPTSSFATVRTSVVKHKPTTVDVGFTSTSRRFGDHENQGTGEETGPGSYETNSMVDHVSKKLVSRTGVFGSTTKRFHTLSDDKVPGPGFYNNEVGGEAAAVPKGNQSCSSAFASSSSRATSAPNNIAPPPGQYESKISWDKGYGNGLVKSGGERFNDRKSHHEIEAPGPGAYNATIDLPKPTGQNRKNVMGTTETRFKPNAGQRNRKQPGPGAYDPEFLYGNLNKPTFNMSIAEGAF